MISLVSLFRRVFKSDTLLIKKEYKYELYREITKDNFSRMVVCSIMLVILECYLYTIEESFYNVGPVILIFLIICAVIIPFVWYIKIRIKTVNIVFASIVQYLFAGLCIVFGATISLYVQSEIDLVHVYLLFVFFTAAFINMHPVGSLILFTSTYLYFFFSLPYYLADANAVFVIKINTAASVAAAWIMSNILWRAKLSVFSNKKLLHKQNGVLKDMNRKDAMTGLLNHEASFKALEEEIKCAQSLNSSLSLIIADIDDFKNVNDNYGHLSGDYVIKNVAGIIAQTVRKTDVVGRYGGEEFIIIMPDTNLKEAYALSERIRQKISDTDLHDNIDVTLSGGISQYSGETMDDFIRITDSKLYAAKSNNKNYFETKAAAFD